MISQTYMTRKTKPLPGQRENEIFDLMYKKVSALVYVDNIRLLITTIDGFNFASKYNITKSPEAVSGVVGVAGSLAFSGAPFQLSYKILEIIKNNISRNHIQNFMAYTIMFTATHTCSGQWQKIISFEKD